MLANIFAYLVVFLVLFFLIASKITLFGVNIFVLLFWGFVICGIMFVVGWVGEKIF